VPASLLAADLGFGYGYKISIQESADLVATDAGSQLRLESFAPATHDTLPVTLFFTSLDMDGVLTRQDADGTANAWISVQGHPAASSASWCSSGFDHDG
jgi:hypothetical protein